MRNRASEIVRIFKLIPFVREGKGDYESISTFVRDLRVYRAFVDKASRAESPKEFSSCVEAIEKYISDREDEGWCPHKKSKKDYGKTIKV